MGGGRVVPLKRSNVRNPKLPKSTDAELVARAVTEI